MMKMKTLAMIHTVSGLVPLFDGLGRKILENVKLFHIADEALLTMIMKTQGLSPIIKQRVCADAIAAEQAGADLILFTCSSISPCADVASELCSIPILKVDTPMIEQAVSLGSRIGVIATAKTTLDPTIGQIHQCADGMQRTVEVKSYLCEKAFEALQEKNPEGHDAFVAHEILQAIEENDVIILAQASMARVLESIPRSSITKPVLTSPESAILAVKLKIDKI